LLTGAADPGWILSVELQIIGIFEDLCSSPSPCIIF
jgi:hypothetical protein